MPRWLMLLLLLVLLPACNDNAGQQVVSVNLDRGKPVVTATAGTPLRIVLGGAIVSEEGVAFYRQFLDLVGKKLERPVAFFLQSSYHETYDLLRGAKVEAALICGYPYVIGQQEFGLELLAVPQIRGKTTYHSLLITHKESPYRKLEDLQGKVFAFADPMSNTGWLVPTFDLWRMGKNPDAFFSRYIYTYGHEKSIKAVAQKLVDGASVDSLVYDDMVAKHNPLVDQIRILAISPPHGIPPVVVPKVMSPDFKTRLREILLTLHQDKGSRQILDGLRIDRFVAVEPQAYDSIRAMHAAIPSMGNLP